MPDVKVTSAHLERDAYLYIRQSTARQVIENTESTLRQYALRERAVTYGWPLERIHVIDNDLGKSGASAQHRDGFQQLVSEVALGKAGIVMGLEVSRLARNSADWHRLIELCAMTGTLILDQDGTYDPTCFNDRLVLGLKGTMSEAELHILKARMRGGVLNKARRGELEMMPPVGLAYQDNGVLGLDPDASIQAALRLVFDTFERTGSAFQSVRKMVEDGFRFPCRQRVGEKKGDLTWAVPSHSRVLQVLRNPRYAGAFVYGRTRARPQPNGRISQKRLPVAQWQFVFPQSHLGYITWEQYLANQQKLTEKYLRVVPTGDPSLFIPLTASFVNFPDETVSAIKKADDGAALVLGRIWGLVPEPLDELLREREEAKVAANDDKSAEYVEVIRATAPNHPLVQEYDKKRGKQKGHEAIGMITGLLEARGCAVGDVARRWAIEHVTLLDHTTLTTVSDVAAMLRRRGDMIGAADIEEAQEKANALMGIRSMRVINDFPLTLAAFGYTRLSRDPSRAVLNPFPANDRGKFPVYAISSETEALWFELDPIAVVIWLNANGLTSERATTLEDAWATLYASVPGLRQSPTEPAYQDAAAVAVRTLLHTVSHVFLRRIEWSGFSPSSVGEYLIPGSLSFILYANRHAEAKIGGLTTLFEQRLSTWLWDAAQSGRECIRPDLYRRWGQLRWVYASRTQLHRIQP